MADVFTIDSLVALLTLASLEIVLGIDNIVFIAIITGRLDPKVQARGRQLGLLAAMGVRILLLLGITWVMRLTAELFSVFDNPISGKDLILIAGGLFLLAKATYEIHHRLEAPEDEGHAGGVRQVASFAGALVQIAAIDVIFSIDSVITAVGMTEGMESYATRLTVMISAIVIAVGVMVAFAGPVSRFIEHHPTMKMLALAFLILIGALLVAEGFHKHIPRGYIYFAMAFSLAVELLNIRARKHRKALRLNIPSIPPTDAA